MLGTGLPALSPHTFCILRPFQPYRDQEQAAFKELCTWQCESTLWLFHLLLQQFVGGRCSDYSHLTNEKAELREVNKLVHNVQKRGEQTCPQCAGREKAGTATQDWLWIFKDSYCHLVFIVWAWFPFIFPFLFFIGVYTVFLFFIVFSDFLSNKQSV